MPEKLYLPMLAKQGSEKDLERKSMIFEMKFDGTRAICYVDKKAEIPVRFMNRRGKWIEYRYPELAEVKQSILVESCVLDGEIVVFDKNGKPNFHLLQEREHAEQELAIKALSKIYPACYVVFDVLEVNGEELTNLKLIDRKKILHTIVKDSERIKKSVFTEQGKKLWEFVKSKKLEGVMAKKKSSFYEQGKRSESWLKIKLFNTIDCVIAGYTQGKGNRAKYFGALLLGLWKDDKLHYAGRVGTGFNELSLSFLKKELEKIEVTQCPFADFDESAEIRKMAHFVEPKLVAEVKYLEFTKNFKLRAPVFVRLRNDKFPIECRV